MRMGISTGGFRMAIVDWLILALASLIALPMGILALECLLALLPVRRSTSDRTSVESASPKNRCACAVLIPAHDEERGIAGTVAAVRSQLRAGDRAIVVADNCSDATAEIARNAGAEVFDRTDTVRRGKGFALEYGLKSLGDNPPPVVVVVDADCRMPPGSIDALVAATERNNRPSQAVYLIESAGTGSPKMQISGFAVRIKNWVRPRGLHRLGLPCLLTGTGMAIPTEALRNAGIGTGNIVEDMKLGIDLALNGYPPQLLPELIVRGEPAPDSGSAKTQRTRWEHGHVRTSISQVPRLALGFVRTGRLSLLGLVLELAVPPVSLLLGFWAVGFAISGMWAAWGGWGLPFQLLIGAFGALAVIVVSVWWRFARDLIPLKALLKIPIYVAWKVPIYLKMVLSPQRKWVRTQRSSVDGR